MKAPIICTICGRTCAYKKELERHMVEVHNADNLIQSKVEKPLHDFLESSGERLIFDKKVETTENATIDKNHNSRHIEFFNQIINKYRGAQLTHILESIKRLSNNELDALAESHQISSLDSLQDFCDLPSLESNTNTEDLNVKTPYNDQEIDAKATEKICFRISRRIK